MNLKEFTLQEAIVQFPNIKALDGFDEFKTRSFDFFLCALGFEDRTLAIPEALQLISTEGFRCAEAIYFNYETSTTHNTFNEPRLLSAFNSFSGKDGKMCVATSMFCDEAVFSDLLKAKFEAKLPVQTSESIDVLLDLSVFSSKLILTLFKVIFDVKRINLTIVYTEAKIYYPLPDEFDGDISKLLEDSPLSTTKGHEDIINSNEYSEGAKENSDLVIAFAPFKAGRINKIVSDIDESILLNNENRLIWLVGKPNFSDESQVAIRMKMLMDINLIDEKNATINDVSTLDYKDTILTLERIYESNQDYHINIADLGSKMQTVGISLYYHIRPDVSVYYALPKEYNSNRYSSGVKGFWTIDFKNFRDIISLIRKIDEFSIEHKSLDGHEFYQ